MPGPARWAWGHCPVRWLNRHALVTLPRVYQRAVASGTELRPVVAHEGVRRVLTVSGVGRLVPVYDTVAAALAGAWGRSPGRPRTWAPRSRCWTGTA